MSIKDIVVVGIFVADLSFNAQKLPIIGETVIGKKYFIGPGGKGSNQAIAIKRSGGNVSLIARVGDDQFGGMGIKLHQSEGTNTEGIIIAKGELTGAATISIDSKGMNSIIVVPGASGGLTSQMIQNKLSLIKKSSILLTGFEVNHRTAEKAILLAKQNNLKTILNPAPFIDFDNKILSLVDYLTPNEHEAFQLTGVKIENLSSAKEAAKILCAMGVGVAIITLGSKGAVCFSNDNKECFHLSPPNLNGQVVDTVGAGDTFNGAFAVAINEGMSIKKSIEFANAAASLAVRKEGAAMSTPRRKEIEKIVK